jgi:hypothetical protein
MSETQTAPVAERSGLLRGAALTAAGIAAASLLTGKSAQAATTGTAITLYFTTAPGTGATFVQIPGTGDIQVLNYALAAETLEAELYRQAVLRLTTGGTDMFGQTITGLNVTGPDVTYLQEFATVEAQHRDYLTAALKGNWVTTAGAKLDFGFADTNNFRTPALTRLQTVELVYAAELTGVSAYLGAIPLFNPAKTYLSVAAAILGTEARHTAFLAATLNGPPFNLAGALKTAPLANENTGRDTPLTPDQVLNQGGTIGAPDNTVAGDGAIGPISGSKGFGGKGFVFI